MHARVDHQQEERETLLQAATLSAKRLLEDVELALAPREIEAFERSLVAQLLVNRRRRAIGPFVAVERRASA